MPEETMTEEMLKTYFPLQRENLDPNKKTYEFALALGGTVSAGAYTAGVLDFIFEALDAWQCAKDKGDPSVPTHNAVLSVMAGASGGAINGAIAIRVAGWEFPHGPTPGNPFYDLWVNGVDLSKLLSGNPKPGDPLNAVLNTAAFDRLATDLIGRTGKPLGSVTSPAKRRYLADPLRLLTMVSNVTGVPYEVPFWGSTTLSHQMIAHADLVRFAATIDGGAANTPRYRPDDVALGYGSPLNWDLVAASALATSAFPLAFPARALKRLRTSFAAPVVVMDEDKAGGGHRVVRLIPHWDEVKDAGVSSEWYRSVNVDGGMFNNEPIDHARIALAGYAGRNPRNGKEAFRGVVLIDPFSDPDTVNLFVPSALDGLIGPLISALVQQARYKPEDIALAGDEDTYSRFLVAPFRPAVGSDASAQGRVCIASGGLGGFIGFVDRSFLEHDFLLGRLNAWLFLKREFVLPSANPIFDGLPAPVRAAYLIKDDKTEAEYLPIIPLMSALRDRLPERPVSSDDRPWPVWPALKTMPDITAAVTAHLDALYQQVKYQGRKDETDKEGKVTKKHWWPGGALGFGIDIAWRNWARAWLCKVLINKVRDGLVGQGLLPKDAP